MPLRRTRRRALILAALATVVALLAAPSAGATRGLSLGIADPGSYFADAPTREARLSQTTAAGAGFVVLSVDWSTISRARRSAAQLANPDDPGYDWSGLDGPVRAASAHGLQIVLSLSRAPAWAEGAHRPRSAAPGTWRPNPGLFGAFVRAAARRYSGAVRYPTPQAVCRRPPKIRALIGDGTQPASRRATAAAVSSDPAPPGQYLSRSDRST